MCYAFPYVLAALPNRIEVRNLDTYQLTQIIHVNNVNHISAKTFNYRGVESAKILVACDKEVFELTEVNLVEQLDMLKQNEMYDEALKLANLIDEAHFDAL